MATLHSTTTGSEERSLWIWKDDRMVKKTITFVFTNNTGKKSEIAKCHRGENWTMVSFKPDFKIFGMECLEDDTVALLKRRVVDLAGCLGKGVKVELDGKRVPPKTFEDYVKLYLPTSMRAALDQRVNSELTPDFLNEITKLGVVNRLFSSADFIQNEKLKKTYGKRKEKLNIPKLKDANLAVSLRRFCQRSCNDMSLSSGLSVVGRDCYGVYPLTGKLLNVREATEYEAWKKKLGDKATKYEIKYYKGLASILAAEGNVYFADLDRHIKDFFWVDNEDDDAIELAFSKTKIEERKDWLRAFKEINVDPFSNYVCAHPAYYYDEASLVGNIVGMAQNYVGSNNINLLQPKGQFGTCRMGGKDHGKGRDFFTQLSPITRYIFHEDDELLLKYLKDGGRSIGPAWFIPIIPMVLVNGSEGSGTGWSSFIPNYNPLDIILIKDENALSITELPVRRWTRDYKEFLEAASQDGKDKTPFIKAYTAHYDVEIKYDTPEQILQEFFDLRLNFYKETKTAQLRELEEALSLLENKVKYIQVFQKKIHLIDGNIDELCQDLKRKGFKPFPAVGEDTEYEYLLSIGYESMSHKKIQELQQEIKAKKEEFDLLTKTSPESLWRTELTALDHQLKKSEIDDMIRNRKMTYESDSDEEE
ncbi:DNA topoisomerase 2 [Tanacetum coccineum]